MCEEGEERNGEGLLWCAGEQRGEGEKEEEKEKKREKVRGNDVRERREERKKRKRKKIGDTWRAASGWKGMMKSSSANRPMTHGKREITLFLKPPNSIN
jgi:hypothetical protein